MNPAAIKMKDKILSVEFKKPLFDIICNVTAQPENNPDVIKKLLVDQICSTVRWRESITHMAKENVTNFIEIGPGKVLSGMVKRTVKDINCFSINSISDIKNLINELKNKKIIITGATGGIGNCLVKKFYQEGANVLASGTNEDKLNTLKKISIKLKLKNLN